MIWRATIGLLLSVLIGWQLSGCAANTAPRTIIIPDSQTVDPSGQETGSFQVDKIYKLNEPEDKTEEVIGWQDPDHLLSVSSGADGGYTIDAMDFRSGTSRNLLHLSRGDIIERISPNGKFLLTSRYNQDSKKTMFTQTNLDSLAPEALEPLTNGKMVSPTWSNNGRYLAYMKYLQSKDGMNQKLFVYDSVRNQGNDFTIQSSEKSQSSLIVSKISEDGKSVLLGKSNGRETVLEYGQLSGNVCTIRYEQAISSMDNSFDFLDNNRFLYIGPTGTLSLYDLRNASTTAVVSGAGAFQLSADRQTIAYVQGQDIVAAQWRGNAVIHANTVYKGAVSGRMAWSPDGKKLLLADGSTSVQRGLLFPHNPGSIALSAASFVISFK